MHEQAGWDMSRVRAHQTDGEDLYGGVEGSMVVSVGVLLLTRMGPGPASGAGGGGA